MIGKGYNGYGTAFNDNLVRLAENFAGSTSPPNPLVGQIWYDNQANAIKFYNGTTFNSISVITAGSSAPANPSIGDEWYNTVTQQLFIWSGASWVLVGPINTAGSGVNGIVIGDIVQNGTTYYFVELYADNRLVGIISSDTLVNPGITGFGNLNPGLNFVTSPTSGVVEGGIYNITNLSIGSNNQIIGGLDASNNGVLSVNGNVNVGQILLVEGYSSSSAQFTAQGAYITWNFNPGTGYTNFINNPGTGGGGFTWYNTNSAGENLIGLLGLTVSGLGIFGGLTYNTGSLSVTLPNDRGSANEVLISLGNGNTEWGTVNNTTPPAGAPGQIQYNSNGTFGGATGIITDGTDLTITGGVLIGDGLTIQTGGLTVGGLAHFENDIHCDGQINTDNGTFTTLSASTSFTTPSLTITNGVVNNALSIGGQLNTEAVFFGQNVSGAGSAAFAGTVQGSTLATNTYSLPTNAGGYGQFLFTNGAGATTWATIPGVSAVINDLRGQRFFGSTYTNASGGLVMVSGYGITSGSSTGTLTCFVNGIPCFGLSVTATIDNGQAGFSFAVPAGATYSVDVGGAITGVGAWAEVTVT